MDDDYDPNVSGGGSRGSTSLPKFNHLYPILFFSHFIRFCGPSSHALKSVSVSPVEARRLLAPLAGGYVR